MSTTVRCLSSCPTWCCLAARPTRMRQKRQRNRQCYGGVKHGKVKILLVNAGIISGGDVSIAANTVIGNIVFKVIGQNTTGTSYKIASEGFSAIAAEKTGETETALTLLAAHSRSQWFP